MLLLTLDHRLQVPVLCFSFKCFIYYFRFQVVFTWVPVCLLCTWNGEFSATKWRWFVGTRGLSITCRFVGTRGFTWIHACNPGNLTCLYACKCVFTVCNMRRYLLLQLFFFTLLALIAGAIYFSAICMLYSFVSITHLACILQLHPFYRLL